MFRQPSLPNCDHSFESSRCEILSRLSRYCIEVVPRFRQQLKKRLGCSKLWNCRMTNVG